MARRSYLAGAALLDAHATDSPLSTLYADYIFTRGLKTVNNNRDGECIFLLFLLQSSFLSTECIAQRWLADGFFALRCGTGFVYYPWVYMRREHWSFGLG